MEPQDSNQDEGQATSPRESQPSRVADVSNLTPEDVRVQQMLEHTIDVGALAGAMNVQAAADAADALEDLEGREATEVLEEMEDRAAAEALAEMQMPLASSVLLDLADEDPPKAGHLLGLMAPDDATDLLQTVPAEIRARLLALMEKEQAREIVQLSAYDRESAGGMMTTDFLALREEMTVEEAIEFIRAEDVPEEIQFALVIDNADRLVGLIGLRRLLITPNPEPIASVMDRQAEAIRPHLDREEVARTFDRYDYSILPVVDEQDRLLGVVTVDDVIDIIHEEQTEDVQKTVGAGAREAVYSTVAEKFRSRFPWLVVNLITSSVAAVVVLQFDDLISELAILAVLMPVIANQAGNAGQQSLAVTLRGIVLDEVRGERVGALILREATIGLLNGLLAGMLVCLAVAGVGMAVGGASWKIGAVAGIAMVAALGVGCLAGAALPLLMRRLGYDPATASTIFLTMLTDSFSFLVFLGTALLLSTWLGI